MKKSAEIIGLPIISIADGTEIGAVKTLVINPEKGSVDFITVEHADWQLSLRAIPFKRVVGIGEFALTIENENAVIDLAEIPIANQLVNKKINITNTRVMTRRGELIGEASEYVIDEESGEILGIELKVKEARPYLPASHILTFGKEIIIVDEEASSAYVEGPSQLLESDKDAEQQGETGEEAMAALKNRQAELLIGKVATKDIYDASGSLLIASGKVLDEEAIAAVQAAGPSAFVELSMNAGE